MNRKLTPRRAAQIRAGILLARMDATCAMVAKRRFDRGELGAGMTPLARRAYLRELRWIWFESLRRIDEAVE